MHVQSTQHSGAAARASKMVIIECPEDLSAVGQLFTKTTYHGLDNAGVLFVQGSICMHVRCRAIADVNCMFMHTTSGASKTWQVRWAHGALERLGVALETLDHETTMRVVLTNASVKEKVSSIFATLVKEEEEAESKQSHKRSRALANEGEEEEENDDDNDVVITKFRPAPPPSHQSVPCSRTGTCICPLYSFLACTKLLTTHLLQATWSLQL